MRCVIMCVYHCTYDFMNISYYRDSIRLISLLMWYVGAVLTTSVRVSECQSVGVSECHMTPASTLYS